MICDACNRTCQCSRRLNTGEGKVLIGLTADEIERLLNGEPLGYDLGRRLQTAKELIGGDGMSKPQLMVYDLKCSLCDGIGKRDIRVPVDWNSFAFWLSKKTCSACDGTGKVPRPYGWRPFEPNRAGDS